MARRDILWSFCTFCHSEAASSMTGEDKLWSSAHPFAIQRRSSPMARKDKLWSFCTFCHPEAASPMTCADKLWSSAHLFAIQRRSSLMARGDKLWSSAQLFVNQRQASPLARRDKLWSFCTFCHPETAGLMTCGETIWSRTFFSLSRDNQVR